MRTAIFDLDGTLVDTAIDLMIAGNYTFEELGWAVRLTTDFKDGIVIGGGRSMIRHGFLAEGLSYTEEEVDNLYPVLLKNYNRTIDQNSYLYDGIIAVLKNLNKAGWNIGVCTNKPEFQANSLLEKLGIRSYFKSFIGSLEGYNQPQYSGKLRRRGRLESRVVPRFDGASSAGPG